MDERFNVTPIAATSNPQTLVYLAARQDYSEFSTLDIDPPTEMDCGHWVVNTLLKGGKGHWGCFEHPQITFNVIGYPHIVVQHLRTHRVGVSFDVQSTRYTGRRIRMFLEGKLSLEEVFYLRTPDSSYTSRFGNRYVYTSGMCSTDIDTLRLLSELYVEKIDNGFSEEHARHILPYCLRQNFVLSCNARSLLHMVAVRCKPDVELETADAVHRMFNVFKTWMPEVADWYEKKELGRARLAP